MCRKHWFMVPQHLRREVWTAWEHYQAGRRTLEQLRAVQARAIDSLKPKGPAEPPRGDRRVNRRTGEPYRPVVEGLAALDSLQRACLLNFAADNYKPRLELLHRLEADGYDAVAVQNLLEKEVADAATRT
jgi:hypothetical protein